MRDACSTSAPLPSTRRTSPAGRPARDMSGRLRREAAAPRARPGDRDACPETRFGTWFISSRVWAEYVVRDSVTDLVRLHGPHRSAWPPVILDVGCGVGGALPMLDEAFAPAALLARDLDPTLLRRAAREVMPRCRCPGRSGRDQRRSARSARRVGGHDPLSPDPASRRRRRIGDPRALPRASARRRAAGRRVMRALHLLAPGALTVPARTSPATSGRRVGRPRPWRRLRGRSGAHQRRHHRNRWSFISSRSSPRRFRAAIRRGFRHRMRTATLTTAPG